MQDKLSVRKVYKNAGVYVVRHFPAFLFLVVLYYVGNLLPMLIGVNSFKIIAIPCFFFFLFIAAGCYYKEKILLDHKILISAGLRFLMAGLLLLSSMLICSFAISLVLDFIGHTFVNGQSFVNLMESATGLVIKYLFGFMLIVIFFVIPAFAFISEISGKSRSFLTAYAKTKGNTLRIATICMLDYILLMSVIGVCTFLRINAFVVEIFRVFILIFIMITYFKMYDFFYKVPQKKSHSKELLHDELLQKDIVKMADEDKETTPDNKIV